MQLNYKMLCWIFEFLLIKSKINFVLFNNVNSLDILILPFDNFCNKFLLFCNFTIVLLIQSTLNGSILNEQDSFNISSLKGKSDEIIGKPQAIASISTFAQPSFKVGNTKISDAL